MASERPHPWPAPELAPLEADLLRCVHCGLCLSACPTYLVTGRETDSPRGRIALARAVAFGELPFEPGVVRAWDRCLQCRACEAACPSGVPYGRIAERLRAQGAAGLRARAARSLRRHLLRLLLGESMVLRLAGRLLRAYSGTPLRRLTAATGRAGPFRRLRALERALPRHLAPPLAAVAPPPGDGRVALVPLGCVMNELLADVHRATVRVLQRTGWRVGTVEGCCGALSLHEGDLGTARRLARRLIARLELFPEATIVLDSAGCGATMKEYPHLFPESDPWHARAARVAARVRDLSEVVEPDSLRGTRLPLRVTYQDPCHLAHVQRLRREPRALLRAIAELELVESPGSDVCCGAAGAYGLVQPEMSERLRSRKARAIAAVGPAAIVTANPGCQLQYHAVVNEHGLQAEVLHLAEVLDRALEARPT